MISLRFACGHTMTFADSETVTQTPRCGCGETRIQRVTPTRPPRFTGACQGPHAETCAVEPQREPLVATRLIRPTEER
jgi:hypothetical protein